MTRRQRQAAPKRKTWANADRQALISQLTHTQRRLWVKSAYSDAFLRGLFPVPVNRPIVTDAEYVVLHDFSWKYRR